MRAARQCVAPICCGQHAHFMWNANILVLKYLPASFFFALNRVPLRMCFPQPPHQML
jgi:hypothetical protein